MHLRTPSICLLTALWIAGALPALAQGRLEINHACATAASGCFSGDGSGYPVSITTPGSYVLTSDLNVSDANTNAIDVPGDFVTIDLNGFTISGPITCTGSGGTLSCGAGTGRGISGGSESLTVRNGRIRRFASHAIINTGGSATWVEGVTVSTNGDTGIVAEGTAIIEDCRAALNAGHGIASIQWSRVSGAISRSNLLDGVNVGFSSLVERTITAENGQDGIETGVRSLVRNSESNMNTGWGLNAGASATVAYGGNGFEGNTAGTVNGGTESGHNACNSSTTCP